MSTGAAEVGVNQALRRHTNGDPLCIVVQDVVPMANALNVQVLDGLHNIGPWPGFASMRGPMDPMFLRFEKGCLVELGAGYL